MLASGGIGTGRAMAAALAAGADGVRVGTRFVASEEVKARPPYVLGAGPDDTVYTDAFSLNYPGTPHRVLSSGRDAAEHFASDIVGEGYRPETGDRVPMYRFQ